MPSIVSVEPLARHKSLLPLIAEWFVAEWPSWYGSGGPGNVVNDLAEFAASEDKIPLGLVVFELGKPVGAGALKAASIPSHSHLSPWAAAGYVLPSHRGRGIGATLLEALVVKASALGFEYVYCGTSTAVNLLTRAGWVQTEITLHESKPLTIFRIAA